MQEAHPDLANAPAPGRAIDYVVTVDDAGELLPTAPSLEDDSIDERELICGLSRKPANFKR